MDHGLSDYAEEEYLEVLRKRINFNYENVYKTLKITHKTLCRDCLPSFYL